MRTLLFACLLTLGGCSLLFPGDASHEGEVLFSGTSFGECLGYCVSELSVEGREATLVYSGSDLDREVPDVRHQRTLSATERTRLDRAFDREALRRADEVYGCPDCADGGAEWVGARFDDSDKRVTFEYGEAVDGLEDYVGAMRDLRASFPDPPQP